MRKGLSLIELIFTVLIIALIFTVIPKLIFAINKSDRFTVKQEALFNGVSMINLVSSLSWDENNTNFNDILHVKNSSLRDCNSSTFYRIGGFIGSRNCENNLSASVISSDGERSFYNFNDIDDFNNYEINASFYGLKISVNYIKDDILFNYSSQSATIYLDNNISVNSTNFKLIELNTTYQGKRGQKGTNIAQFSYVSSNIGQIYINKRAW